MPTSPSSDKPRVMVDTGILLAGTIWPRFSYEVLRHALRGGLLLVLSPTIIKEARRKFAEKFPNFVQDFEGCLQGLWYEVVPDPTSEEVLADRDLMRDITDLPIALAGIDAGVDHFSSEDKDFTASHHTTPDCTNGCTCSSPEPSFVRPWGGRARNWKRFGAATGRISFKSSPDSRHWRPCAVPACAARSSRAAWGSTTFTIRRPLVAGDTADAARVVAASGDANEAAG